MRKNLYLFALLFLAACTSATADKAKSDEAAAPVKETSVPKGSIKLGTFHAYQLSGAGFGYQYKFDLLENGEYIMFDKKGTYAYDGETNVIRFTSGGLKDYTGVFTRVNHVNDTRKVMIVLDFHGDGAIPDTLALGKKPGGYYQYAYYQGEQ